MGMSMVAGCCSAISPCSHQQKDPSTICAKCQEAQDRYVSETKAKQLRDAKAVLWAAGYKIIPPAPQ
jgi:D-serine dehydratase